MKLFSYLGDHSIPYRTIMTNHKDFKASDVLIPKSRCVIAEQTHSVNVHPCTEADCGAGFDDNPQIQDCDALVTNLPDIFLLIRTADCTPVLLFDEVSKCIGAVHSGREGTRKNITGQTVKTMIRLYSAEPSDIKAWIGPGICKKHYPVSEEIWTDFYLTCTKSNFFVDESDFLFPDIQSVILQQLTAVGLKQENIIKNEICTFESNGHFSYRRDKTRNRQINIIGMINGKHNL
jgi:polyphenol oxidase